MDLEGRVAVVTGAASGIGLAIVEAFVAVRMRVLMVDRDQEKLSRHEQRLKDQGERVHAVVADVTDPEQMERTAATAIEQFGLLHIAVNNAGVVNRGYSWELPLEEWHRIIDVDLWGVVHGIRAYVPRILAGGEEGHVVNVASMAAVSTVNQLGPYTAAKHGVLGLTDVLGAEFASLGAPIGTSVVMPGMVKTGMNPIGTIEPSKVAANVVDAIVNGRRYVFTDDQNTEEVEKRLRAILAARSAVI